MTGLRSFRPARRRTLKRVGITTLFACAVAAVATTVAGSTPSTATPTAASVRQEYMQHLRQLSTYGLLSWPAQVAVARIADGQSQPSPTDIPSIGDSIRAAGTQATGPGLTNVRVNNPLEDSHFVDQTTQSETTIGVTGQNVIVGFNDSQTALPAALTAGLNLTGYAYSSNGGKSFTDGGVIPNPPGLNNIGDPSVGTDRAGNVYFSTLVLDYFGRSLGVGVAKSTDGGKTFSAPTIVSPSNDLFYGGDKDLLAVGPDPGNNSADDIYVAWDDQFVTQSGRNFSGLPVARSTDGGQTWHVSYADKVRLSHNCSLVQYIGADPVVASDGTLYVAAERFSVSDPHCTGDKPFASSEWIFKSTDGGKTFGAGHRIALVTETGDLDLGHAMVMRNLELPSVAIGSTGAVYVAWNDASPGHSNIRLATSTDGGSTWAHVWATTGDNDDVQPALSADAAGLHLLYYERNPDNTLDVLVGDSTTGTAPFAPTRVTSTSFPGVLTLPQFDPIIARGYMGDYIANVSDGTHQYFAWGDNRDTITNFMWPQGRHDPDVYFAKR